MRFSSSRPAEGDYYQSEEFRLAVDFDSQEVCIERTLVRYGPGDDFQRLTDIVLSFEAFSADVETQRLVSEWFGEQVLANVVSEIKSKKASNETDI